MADAAEPQSRGDWRRVADAPPAAYPATFRYDHEGVVVLEYDGRLYALSRWCPHGWADLRDGWCADGLLHCPLHGFRFDLETGAGRSHHAFNLTAYEVRVSAEGVFLRPKAR